MQLIFKEIVICDFKAFRGQHRLRLDYSGVTYIFGENEATKSLHGNGAAKSTIWDALVWCFYGKTALGLHNPDIMPWAGGKPSVMVKVTLDGKQHLVQRSASPNRFTCDGKDIVDIRSVVDISFELFINTILLPQKKELFLERSPTDKMRLFSEAMPLERWDTRSTAASRATEALNAEALTLEGARQQAIGALDEVNLSLASAKKAAEEWANASRVKVRVSDKQIEALQRQRAALDKKLSTAILAEDGALTEVRGCEVGLRKLRIGLVAFESKLGSTQGHIRSTSAQLDRVELEIEALLQAKTCPACGQAVTPRDIASHKDELARQAESLEAELASKNSELKKLQVQLSNVKAAIKGVESEITSFEAKANDAGDVIVRYRPEIAELDRKIKSMRESKSEVNPHTTQVAELVARVKSITRELKEIDSELVRTRSEAEHNRFWIRGFKDIKLQLIEDVLSELEIVANSMIDEVGLEGWKIKFDIERESKSGSVTSMINVEVVSPESRDKAVKWAAASGGEGQRLRLIGSLALADVLLAHAGIETNLEVLDEPAVYWAGEGVQELIEFLAIRARERDKSVFIIEHSAVESVNFARTITVVKSKSGARIVL